MQLQQITEAIERMAPNTITAVGADNSTFPQSHMPFSAIYLQGLKKKTTLVYKTNIILDVRATKNLI